MILLLGLGTHPACFQPLILPLLSRISICCVVNHLPHCGSRRSVSTTENRNVTGFSGKVSLSHPVVDGRLQGTGGGRAGVSP